MIYSIPNQVFQKFIEGPKQFNNTVSGMDGKATAQPDLKLNVDTTDEFSGWAYDSDIPYYEANERYD